MPYRYLEDIATADVAFAAWGSSREELFCASADALLNTMVDDLSTVREERTIDIQLEEEELDLLLFNLLQELLFFKDAARLLLRVRQLKIIQESARCRLTATLAGESIDQTRHPMLVDVKAVTLHLFSVKWTGTAWEARVILDI